jgi:hypothetical protein
MIPYRDENQTQRRAIVTATIIGLNVFTWLVVQGAGADFPLAKSVCEIGLIPGQFTECILPRSANIRRVFVDSSTTPVTFWVGSNRGTSIIELEALD